MANDVSNNNDKFIQQQLPQSQPLANAQSFQQQTAGGFDFSSFASPSDILAPHPDLFESELDSTLAGFDPSELQSLIDNETDAFTFFRTDTPTCGPPSTFTVSSESAYETLSSYSESIYRQATSELGLPLNFDMDFARASISTAHSDYGSTNAQHQHQHQQHQTLSAAAAGLDVISDSDYGYHSSASPPVQTGTANSSSSSPVGGNGPPRSGSVYNDSSEYPLARHPSLAYNAVVPTAIPARQQYIQPPQPRSPSPVGIGLSMSLLPRITRTDPAPRSHVRHPSHAAYAQQQGQPVADHRHAHGQEHHEDARKKHRCPQCPRAFARAFNLKQHLPTHDPNRQKLFTCTKANCDRSFSRKHDLGRHLTAIHGENPDGFKNLNSNGSECGSAYSQRSIGVAAGNKFGRCDKCGASGPKKCACKASGATK